MEDIRSFGTELKDEIMNAVPDEIRNGLTLKETEITKVNDQKLFGFMFRRGGSDASPAIYVNQLFERFLKRKLTEEGTSFQKQLNGTREILAKHYIRNTDMTSDEIAFLLGYQETNSFLRAFSLWTGMTISEFKTSI